MNIKFVLPMHFELRNSVVFTYCRLYNPKIYFDVLILSYYSICIRIL